jgi:hypothetical protein
MTALEAVQTSSVNIGAHGWMPSGPSWLAASVPENCPLNPERNHNDHRLADQIGAASREVAEQQTEHGQVVVVTLQRYFAAEPADVWQAITNPAEISSSKVTLVARS